jgi:MOSC domain-containing protein YiiM
MMGKVVAVHICAKHVFSKSSVESIRLLKGLGVEGDAHCGATVKHRSRVAKDPTQPNLRQVHLIHSELLDEFQLSGVNVSPGALGENITTQGIDLLALPLGTELIISGVALRITGLRNPCKQIDHFKQGLLSMVLRRSENGQLIRKAGIMSVVIEGGTITPGDKIEIKLPPLPHTVLDWV